MRNRGKILGFLIILMVGALSGCAGPDYTDKDVGGDTGSLAQICKQLGDKARHAISEYMKLLADFEKGDASCEQLHNQYELVRDNADRCLATCDVVHCPSRPLGPGLFPGTERCKKP